MYLTLPSYSLSPPLFFWVLPGECLVTGQSHFKSFDNRYFTFSGICQYQLARDCQDHSFSIVIETVQVSSARLPVRGQQSLMVRRQGLSWVAGAPVCAQEGALLLAFSDFMQTQSIFPFLAPERWLLFVIQEGHPLKSRLWLPKPLLFETEG